LKEKPMKVMVVGSGGREHALSWKISQSEQVKKIYCAPGNAGMRDIGELVPIHSSDIGGLQKFAMEEKIDLTVVGPEEPLTMGIVDEFEKSGLKIFGAARNAAELEGSKVFAKRFMERHQIPTARFKVAETSEQAMEILDARTFSPPFVVKADGLAAGKGATICENLKQAQEAVRHMMIDRKFGGAGDKVVIEEFLRGKEVSFIVLSDGIRVLPLVTTMDHKAVFDGDKGPNTGGMGAISPSPFITRELFQQVMDTIIFPTVTRMLEEGRKLKGVLYAGLMLTEEGPKVLEYNCRFGDPETQPQMLRLESDLVDLLLSAVSGNILKPEVKWSENPSGCVILASGGYPVKYEKGMVIKGLRDTRELSRIIVFHAGTKYESGEFFTNGGRVLGVCASEKTLTETMDAIYEAVSNIHFQGMHFRKDIGAAKEEK
jgi:phosphoribosylamine--glycine ligase